MAEFTKSYELDVASQKLNKSIRNIKPYQKIRKSTING